MNKKTVCVCVAQSQKKNKKTPKKQTNKQTKKPPKSLFDEFSYSFNT